jgi:acetate kinase
MKVISVNAGSSSLKFRMFEMPEEKVLIKGVFERIGINNSFYTIEFNSNKIKKEVELKNHEDAVKILMQELLDNNIISSLSELSGVSHRLVHGGDKYPNSCILNEEVIKEVESIKDLAPLHVPANLMCVKAFMKEVPNTIQVGCFDTAFHQTLEEDKYIYPIPYSYYIDYKVRKYGFHGMSYKYITETMKEKLNKDSVNLIVCHIGQGASISAIKDNKSYDTSMGFTPNSGIVMGTRSGDIDYGIIKYMMNNSDKSFDDIDKDLNKKSGLYGISMVSSDWRDVDAAIKEGNKNAKLAHYVFVNSIVSYISKYFVELNGDIDALVFTAGVGENAPHIRRMVVERINCLGFKIDRELNDITRLGKEGKISTKDSKYDIYVVPTNEELMMARDCVSLIK